VLFFGGLFLGYTVYRYWYFAAFALGSHHLDVVLGAVNTGVLLLSSLTMALAVHAVQTDRLKQAAGFLAATAVLGAAFLGIKFNEYEHKFHDRLVPGHRFSLESLIEDRPEEERAALRSFEGPAELFYSFYFAMTGVHALHMVIGICVVAWVLVSTMRGRFNSVYHTPVEMTGLYWHFVDIVWVFLFPLLYLIGPHP
jgi:cytochrome c oxidase subunit 3